MTDRLLLITGATGFLGREVLLRLLRGDRAVLIAIRRKDQETEADARGRIRAMIDRTEPGTPFDRGEIAFGDVTEPQLGLAPEVIARLERSEQPVQIIHGAAEVRFDLPWEVMERQNVGGTENVLALARRLEATGRLHRLDYVSTTYVAGDRTDLAREDQIDVGQGTRNDYERSKLAAEGAIERERKAGLPVVVHRPSIIVGDSRSGRASSFKVLYWPLKLYARGRWKTIFGRPDCPMDVVPVDFVADAMVHLFDDPRALGHTFHLAAGPERQSTIGELVALSEQRFQKGAVRYVDPDLYLKYLRPMVRPLIKLIRPDVADKGKAFLPYLRGNPTFAVDQARSLLEPAGIQPPRVPDYFSMILDYAVETDFGRALAA